MDTKLICLTVMLVAIICHTTNSEDSGERQVYVTVNSMEQDDKEHEPPMVKIRRHRKCHRKIIETTLSPMEINTENMELLINPNITELIDSNDEKQLNLSRMTREEIEDRCRTTTEYNTYIECIQHLETIKSRAKRFVNSCGGGGDLDDDYEEFDECDLHYEDCENCINTCRNCYSKHTCRTCNSCSLCTNRRCCTKLCRRGCQSSACRAGCRQDCINRIETNLANPNLTLINRLEEAVNITTVIKLNNLINTTNLVDIPIKINSTNINNITIEESKHSSQPSEGLVDPQSSDGRYGIDATNPQGYPCCHIVYPRECHDIKEYPYKRCFHRRRRFCGPQCVSEVIFYPNTNIPTNIRTDQTPVVPPVTQPLMPPVMPPIMPPMMTTMMMPTSPYMYNYYNPYSHNYPMTPTAYSDSNCVTGTDHLGTRCTRATDHHYGYYGYNYSPNPLMYFGVYPYFVNFGSYYPYYPYYNPMYGFYNHTNFNQSEFHHNNASTIPIEEQDS